MSPGKRLLQRLRQLLGSSGNISDRTVTGGVWVALNNVVDRVLQLGTILFLAQLIGPAAFGLFGIALVTQSALNRLTKLGLDSALIQHQDDDVDTYLDTVWTVELARGVLLGAALYLFAPFVSSVFGEPRVTAILRVFALFPIISGLQNPGIVYFVKDLEFHRDVAYKLSSRIVYVLVGVGVGYATRSVWALVFASLASNVTSLVVSYLIHSYRPWPRFDRSVATELFGYGKWIFGSEALSFLINEGDDAFVGWALGTGPLGIYQLSYRLSNAPATEITHPIQRVLFPAYSKVQDDVASLRSGYFLTVRVITLLSFPASVGIAVVAPVFVPAVLGTEWAEMVVPMQVFAAYAAVRSFRSATVPLFRAIGRPDYDTKIRILKLALLLPFIYPASELLGVTGVALVILGHTLVVAPIASYIAVRSVDGRMATFARNVLYPACGSAVMGTVVYVAREQIDAIPLVAELVLLIVSGVLAYGAVMTVLEKRIGIGLDRLYRIVHEWAH
jgi:O-antigen/teichoic acid export membrane protein